MRYHRKPLEVEAFRFNGHSVRELPAWLPRERVTPLMGAALELETDEGCAIVDRGDWIVLAEGKFLVLEDALFTSLFDPAPAERAA